MYLNTVYAFQDKDVKDLSVNSAKFLQLIKDIEELLATDDNFLLGPWLESAKNLSTNADEKKQVSFTSCFSVMLMIQSMRFVDLL